MSSVSKNHHTPARVHLWHHTCQHTCGNEHQCVLVHPESNWISFKHHLLQSSLCLDTQKPILAHLLKWKLCGKSIQYNNKSNFYANKCNDGAPNAHWDILPRCSEDAQTDRRKWGWRHKVGSQSCGAVQAVNPSWVATHTIGSVWYHLLKEKQSRWETSLLKSSPLSWR